MFNRAFQQKSVYHILPNNYRRVHFCVSHKTLYLHTKMIMLIFFVYIPVLVLSDSICQGGEFQFLLRERNLKAHSIIHKKSIVIFYCCYQTFSSPNKLIYRNICNNKLTPLYAVMRTMKHSILQN